MHYIHISCENAILTTYMYFLLQSKTPPLRKKKTKKNNPKWQREMLCTITLSYETYIPTHCPDSSQTQQRQQSQARKAWWVSLNEEWGTGNQAGQHGPGLEFRTREIECSKMCRYLPRPESRIQQKLMETCKKLHKSNFKNTWKE